MNTLLPLAIVMIPAAVAAVAFGQDDLLDAGALGFDQVGR